MAVSVSRRVFRSFGPLYGHHRSDYQRIPFRATDALYSHDSSDSPSSVETFNFGKSVLSFLGCRGLSTSVLTPESNDGDFPSQLLSTKGVVTPEHTRGRTLFTVLYDCSSQRDDREHIQQKLLARSVGQGKSLGNRRGWA